MPHHPPTASPPRPAPPPRPPRPAAAPTGRAPGATATPGPAPAPTATPGRAPGATATPGPAAAPTHAPGPADLRLVVPAVATWFAAALATASPRLAAAALTAAALVTAAALRRLAPERRRTAVAAATLVCAAAAVAATTARAATTSAGPLASLARREAVVTVDLAVTDDPRVVTGRVVGAQRVADLAVVPARAERLALGSRAVALRAPLTVLARPDQWRDRLPGEHLRVTGRLRPPRPGDTAPTLDPHGPPTRLRPASVLGRVAGRLRAGLHRAAEPLPPAARGLLPGLVVGDTSRLDPAVREDFRRTGLTHVVAVSGQNIAILLTVALLLARRAGAGPRAATVAGAAVLGFYVLVARPSPSVLRAAVMGGLALVGTVTGRERAALRLLAAAVLFLLLADPGLATSIGFALSAAATAGLLVLAPPWRRRLATRLPGWLADAVAPPLAAQVACAPLLAAAFGRVSLAALPANVLAAPAVAPATVLGFVAAGLAPVALPAARVAALLAGVPTAWLVTVARHGATVPAATVGVPTGLAGAALTVALLGAAAYALRRRAAVTATAAATALLAAVLVAQLPPGWPPPGWRVLVCDVGQGDAIVVRTNAAAVLVDAGPDPLAADRCLRDAGVRRLAAVVLTHFHADHVEGLPGALRGRRAGALVVSPLAEPAEERDRVARWAARLPTRTAALGERWAVGDTAFEVLGPEAAFRGTASDPNNSSLVLRVTAPGLTALLTGDIEEPAQLAVLARGAPGHADVLKVPHHGSARQTADFLDATGAAAAVVSAGRGNPYGHPAPSTLDALALRGMRAFRTDRDGDVAVTTGARGVRVTGRRGRGTPPRPPAPWERALAFRRAAAPGLWCPLPLRAAPPAAAPRAAPPRATPPRRAAPPRPIAPPAARQRPAASPPPTTAAPARDPPPHPVTRAPTTPAARRDILSPCPPR
ncbi:MAG TPA: DNA internalization-related competence protein ComEC/Rec2, partial [Solirubrobacteraceae bacterium]|nr:DNA internalization-related competence protein ComEC/Rec2 [Solirubrobacteraceae bacterium]